MRRAALLLRRQKVLIILEEQALRAAVIQIRLLVSHRNSDKGFNGNWNGKKISEKVGNCEHLKTLETNNAAGNKIEDNLEKPDAPLFMESTSTLILM